MSIFDTPGRLVGGRSDCAPAHIAAFCYTCFADLSMKGDSPPDQPWREVGQLTTVLLHVSAVDGVLIGVAPKPQCIGPECGADCCRNEAAQGRVGRPAVRSCSCIERASDIGLVERKCVSKGPGLVVDLN